MSTVTSWATSESGCLLSSFFDKVLKGAIRIYLAFPLISSRVGKKNKRRMEKKSMVELWLYNGASGSDYVYIHIKYQEGHDSPA